MQTIRHVIHIALFCAAAGGQAMSQDGLGALLEQATDAQPGPPEADRRVPVPSAAATKQALAKIKDIFGDDYAKAANPQGRSGLARQLLTQAEKTHVPAERWALSSEAMRLAADAGDAELCFDAITKSATYFAIDSDELKIDALTKLSVKAAPEAVDGLARTALTIAKKTADSGDPSATTKILALASSLARKTKNRAIIAEVAQVQQAARDQEKEAKEAAAVAAKLAANPGDPGACLEAGKYFCFKANDWDRGLPLLAKGSDASLARLAVAETNGGKTVEAVASLGDAWWDWAEKERGSAKAGGMAHAADLYASVVSKLQGLDRTKLEKRIKEAQSDITGRRKRVALAALTEESATGMQYGFSKDGTFKGRPFTCCNQAWPKALQAMTTPNGTSIKYRVPAGAKTLVGKAGVFGPEGAGAGQHPSAPLQFEILVDGHSAWKSEPLPKQNDTANFRVELFGATEVELRTVSASPSSAWSAWLDPEFVF